MQDRVSVPIKDASPSASWRCRRCLCIRPSDQALDFDDGVGGFVSASDERGGPTRCFRRMRWLLLPGDATGQRQWINSSQ
jgi:hypothetical protein